MAAVELPASSAPHDPPPRGLPPSLPPNFFGPPHACRSNTAYIVGSSLAIRRLSMTLSKISIFLHLHRYLRWASSSDVRTQSS